MVAHDSIRSVGLETQEMVRLIQAKTSEISEDFAKLELSFSVAKLGIHHCQPMHNRTEPDPSSPQMKSSVNGYQLQIHLPTITKHALSDKFRLAIGSYGAAVSRSGKRTRILVSGYMAFPDAAKLSYAPQ